MLKAEVFVTLKPVVNDPEGMTIRGGLHALGFESVSEVRSGKYLVLTLNQPDPEKARQEVEQMAHQLLANEVIEDYRINLLESFPATPPSPLRGGSGRGS